MQNNDQASRRTRSSGGHHFHKVRPRTLRGGCTDSLIRRNAAMAEILQTFLKCLLACAAVPSISASLIRRRCWTASCGGFSAECHSGAARADYGSIGKILSKTLQLPRTGARSPIELCDGKVDPALLVVSRVVHWVRRPSCVATVSSRLHRHRGHKRFCQSDGLAVPGAKHCSNALHFLSARIHLVGPQFLGQPLYIQRDCAWMASNSSCRRDV